MNSAAAVTSSNPQSNSQSQTQAAPQQVTAQQTSGSGTSNIQPPDSAALEELEHQMDLLSSRASAVSGSIEKLRSEQNAQGYNLRGDIAAAADRMATYMNKAQQALQNQDARNAKRYMDLAEPEVERLEKFLGR
jgi:serine/threonine-protein kinase